MLGTGTLPAHAFVNVCVQMLHTHTTHINTERGRVGSRARRRNRSIIYTCNNTKNRGEYIGSAAERGGEPVIVAGVMINKLNTNFF